MVALPLAGKRVLVTRAAHQAGKLCEGLRALGVEPVEVPVIEIRPPEDLRPLDRALRTLDSYDWLILTSANTVRALAERLSQLKIPIQSAAPPQVAQVAAIGEATATAARQAGFAVALVPESYVAESLSKSLAGQTRGKKVLLARAAVARDVIPDALRAAGATVDVVDAYRNVMPESAPALLREALQKGIAAAAFTSSSSATHLAEAARQAGIEFPFAGVAAISIGPITSQTLRELGWQPAAEASPSEVPGLIQAVTRALQ
ncbi:MAG: uroporphyrinogen-III synthase [Terracidiphilus sp.]|jgi:uroporphyrinogen-III synthase/uroporphyrinogen III methyltransferase/synthase